MTKSKFTLHCPNCDGTRFRVATGKPTPDDSLTCAGCGTIVDLREVKARLERETRAAIEERMGDPLKRK